MKNYLFKCPPLLAPFVSLWPLYVFFLALAVVGTAAKIITAPDFDWSLAVFLKMLAFGWAETTAAFLWAVLHFLLFACLLPQRFRFSRLGRCLASVGLYLWLFLIVFSRTAEFLFWREFGASFNFIAVDYLIYTTELLLNIWQTFPVVWLLLLDAFAAAAVFYWLVSRKSFLAEIRRPFSARLVSLAVGLLLTLLAFCLVDGQMAESVSENRFNQEAAKNDLYSFGNAFLSNDLSYKDFYLTKDKAENAALLRARYAKTGKWLNKDLQSLRRHVAPAKAIAPKKLNVVCVVMESMGQEFMGEAGIYQNLTPNLDRLSREGLYFSNTYATGTRTVRGLEAVVLSLPPQAGMSVIRQKDNGNLHGTGEIFRTAGYSTKWIYGGYGYFDNMNDFFATNGFEIIDRLNIADAKIHHQTAWGVADEDLYTKAIEEADKSYAGGEKFFQLVLTTSNHSPYTYPAGRVTIPSGTGRLGAVQYADYAIGDFIERAKQKPWFAETVFVFISDHGAKAAGKQELNPEKHHIIFAIYSPQNIAPRRFDCVISQIDAMPTLLGQLGWSYDSSFFGEDVLAADYNMRYFLSNYQYIGYADKSGLAVLKPVRQVVYYMNDGFDDETHRAALLNNAIAYYQYGSRWREYLRE